MVAPNLLVKITTSLAIETRSPRAESSSQYLPRARRTKCSLPSGPAASFWTIPLPYEKHPVIWLMIAIIWLLYGYYMVNNNLVGG